jgi:hypothetical protein
MHPSYLLCALWLFGAPRALLGLARMLMSGRMLARAFRHARVSAWVVCCIFFYLMCALWLFGGPGTLLGLARML